MFPAWFACTVTVPAPEMVSMFPLTVAGPEITA
jgi:hypothetical protein